MKNLIHLCLNKAQICGSSYADIRIINSQKEALSVKNGKVEEISASESLGFGVRVLANGAWGFASSNKVEKKEIAKVTSLAVKIAKASALLKKNDVVVGKTDVVKDTYQTPVKIDPFSVSLDEKLELLNSAEQTMRQNKGVSISSASMDAFCKNQIFANTEGSYITQQITYCGAGISAIAIKAGDMQQRSYPNSFRGTFAAQGYEYIKSLKLAQNAHRVGSEATMLLSAKECPTEETTIILVGPQLALQIHESIGHPTELDRVLGMEASFAGESFLTLDKLGKFQLGSSIVNIIADATIPGGLGTFGYDDEGVKAQRSRLIENGCLVGYLTSRETANRIGLRSNGTARAESFNSIPLIRMTNVNLEPGEKSLDEIVSETKEGFLLDTNKSWSIDDRRLNFQFATEIGWEVRNGKVKRAVKNPNYTGITYEFWNSCDAIANKENFQIWGLPNCGKGEPVQTAHVGHGASAARFRKVKIGVGKK